MAFVHPLAAIAEIHTARRNKIVSLCAYRRRREVLGHGKDIDRLCREADEALAEWRKHNEERT